MPEVLRWVDTAPGIDGVTLTGGEPLQQWRALSLLLDGLRHRPELSTILLTGFSHEEIRRMGRLPVIERSVDVLIAGRYVSAMHLGHGLRGSSNKTVHFISDRYSAQDLDDVPEVEILIDSAGDVTATGMEALGW